jgi:hypothetical protein
MQYLKVVLITCSNLFIAIAALAGVMWLIGL